MAAAAVTLAVKVGISELTAHSARLKGATNENEAAESAVTAFDADMAAINQAFNNGEASESTVISALNAVSASIYSYLHSLVGAAGTAWTPNSTCNKSCTVSCCLYYDDLLPSIKNAVAAVQTSGGASSQVLEVFGDKYGLQTRPGYTLNWHQTEAGNVKASLTSTIDELTGQTILPSVSAPATSLATSTSINPLYLFVGLIFVGVAVLISAMGRK